MGLLDWIRDRNETTPKAADVSRRCTPSYEKQATDWKQKTGKECAKKEPPKREKSRGRVCRAEGSVRSYAPHRGHVYKRFCHCDVLILPHTRFSCSG